MGLLTDPINLGSKRLYLLLRFVASWIKGLNSLGRFISIFS